MHVETAEEMHRAVVSAAGDADVVVMAAAVADFRPKAVADGKLKKESGTPELHLEPTPDILRELGERKGDRILVGFAAETSDLETAGRGKLHAKHLDLVVVNEVGPRGDRVRLGDERRDDPERRRRRRAAPHMDQDRARRSHLRPHRLADRARRAASVTAAILART